MWSAQFGGYVFKRLVGPRNAVAEFARRVSPLAGSRLFIQPAKEFGPHFPGNFGPLFSGSLPVAPANSNLRGHPATLKLFSTSENASVSEGSERHLF